MRTRLGMAGVLAAAALAVAPASSASNLAAVPASGNKAQLTGVAAVASDDVWAVGRQYGGGVKTLVEHWDGSGWSTIASANPGTQSDSLSAVTAVSADDIWAVGNQQSPGDSPRPLIEHWDGASWTAVTLPETDQTKRATLKAVSTDASNDVWAVGDRPGRAGAPVVPFAEHWDGSSWSVSEPQRIAHDTEDVLTGVLAVAPNDVRAVGFRLHNDQARTLVEQWDGTAWTISQGGPSNRAGYLWAIASDSDGGAWAVGENSHPAGSLTTLIERQTDTWSRVRSPSPGTCLLLGVTSIAADDAWAVGMCVGDGPYTTLTEHWDGSSWTVVASPNPRASNSLLGVVAVTTDDVWAVGSQFNATGDIRLHWDGGDWTSQ